MSSYKCNAVLIQISVATYFTLDKVHDYLDRSPKGIWQSSKPFLIKKKQSRLTDGC